MEKNLLPPRHMIMTNNKFMYINREGKLVVLEPEIPKPIKSLFENKAEDAVAKDLTSP